MLKNYFFFIFLFIFLSNINDQKTYVPDDNFEQTLVDFGYDDVLDDYVVTSNISGVTSLNVSNKNISDLTGIEDFGSLQNLYCGRNQITELDVTKNTSLISLICYANQLTSLDVTQNTLLTNLYCNTNQLTSLDVTQNTLLIFLMCHTNQLTSLNVTQNTDLTNLYCSDNQLTSLNVTQNTDLIHLDCFNNQLTSLDVTQNTSLTDISCYTNQLTSLDVTQNISLTVLHCYANQLTSLDVTQNSSLTGLDCYDNQLTSLDVTQNSSLTGLYCHNNQLTSLNIKNGNNVIINEVLTYNNPSLHCIQVDNEIDANNGVSPYYTVKWIKDVSATYSEDCSSYLGVDDEILVEGLNLYPNPVYNTLTIESITPLKKVEIFNILGQKEIDINSGLNSISTDNLSEGIYFIKIHSEKGTTVRKLIKQ